MRTRGGGVQNRGTAWRISYYDLNGFRQYESFPTEDEARRELAKRIADVAQGIPVTAKPTTVTFGELAADVVNDYKVNRRRSMDDIETRFRLHILPIFQKRKAAQITTAQLNAYIVRRRESNPVPADGTINRELEAIRHTFRLALQNGKLLRMPHVPHLRENNTRTGFFTRTEVDALCAALPEPYRSFTKFGFLTGWRLSECQNLQWSNVDFPAGEVRLSPGTTKTGEGRVFPMNTELRTLLKAMRKKAAFGYVFTVNKQGAQVKQFQKTWKAACRKAGLPVVLTSDGKKVLKAVRTFHDLRRSAAREFQRQGFTEGQIMRMCGWKSRSVFDRYNIVTNDDIRKRMAEIEGRTFNGAANGAKEGTDTRKTQ